MVRASFLGSVGWLLAVPGSPLAEVRHPGHPGKAVPCLVGSGLVLGRGGVFEGSKGGAEENVGGTTRKKMSAWGQNKNQCSYISKFKGMSNTGRGDREEACKQLGSLCCSESYLSQCG